jgi:hypothetical protein
MTEGTITLAWVQEHIARLQGAIAAVCDGLSVTMNGRTLTRVNLPDLQASLARWTRVEARMLGRQAGDRGAELGVRVARFRSGPHG